MCEFARSLQRVFLICLLALCGGTAFGVEPKAVVAVELKGEAFVIDATVDVPVPLETADILPAIQTGMINVVPSTPYFALASQIYSSAPQMLEINWAPIVGALVLTRKAWDEMSPAAQESLRAAGEKAGVQLRSKARQEVTDAVDAMKLRGLVVNRPTPEQMREWNELAEKLYPRIRGTLVPAETFDEVFALLKTYRAGKAK